MRQILFTFTSVFIFLVFLASPGYADGIRMGEYRGTGSMQYSNDFAPGYSDSNDACAVALDLDYTAPFLSYTFSEYCYLGTPTAGPANDIQLNFYVAPNDAIFLILADGTYTDAPVGQKMGNHFQIQLERQARVRLRRQPTYLRSRFLTHYQDFCTRTETSTITLREYREYEFSLNGNQIDWRRYNRREHLPFFASQSCRERFDAERLKFAIELEHNVELTSQ